MTEKFTPGSWGIHKYDVAAVTDPDGHIIINCAGWSDNSRDIEELQGEQRANAYLVSAAPDLYEALVNVLDWADPFALPDCDRNESSVERAKAALAKARGEDNED